MRLRSLATSREITLAALAVALLALTGSTSQVPTDPLAPIPSAPGSPTVAAPPAAGPTAAPRAAPTAAPKAGTKPRTARKPAPAPGPRVPVVDASPKRAVVDERVFPGRLASRDLDLDLPVRPVGVTENGEMELPDTVDTVGWYRFGAHPAARTGTTVLAAHVDTRAEGLGPFARLRDAHEGDEITVVDRAGRESRYRVADVRSLAKKRIDWQQVFDRGGNPRLVLITCGGAYDQDSGYRDNVLVTAFPLT